MMDFLADFFFVVAVTNPVVTSLKIILKKSAMVMSRSNRNNDDVRTGMLKAHSFCQLPDDFFNRFFFMSLLETRLTF